MDELKEVSKSFYNPVPVDFFLISDINLYFDPRNPQKSVDDYPLWMRFYSKHLQLAAYVFERNPGIAGKAVSAFVDSPTSRAVRKTQRYIREYIDVVTECSERISDSGLSLAEVKKEAKTALLNFYGNMNSLFFGSQKKHGILHALCSRLFG